MISREGWHVNHFTPHPFLTYSLLVLVFLYPFLPYPLLPFVLPLSLLFLPFAGLFSSFIPSLLKYFLRHTLVSSFI